jgi:hypothetical protein
LDGNWLRAIASLFIKLSNHECLAVPMTTGLHSRRL